MTPGTRCEMCKDHADEVCFLETGQRRVTYLCPGCADHLIRYIGESSELYDEPPGH